ncbi:MAG: response regulator [Acetobacteraceae bacterium]|nr:response regulator [Acetobacteraceae bacterium]
MPAEAPRRAATEDTGSGTVLVVEDNPEVLAAASEMLQALGYSIATASNAADALAILHSGREVDVLFSDVLLPGGMLGEALAREAQRMRPGLRVLLTSGYAGSADAAEAGMVFLAKPYRRAELAEKLREAMRRPAGPVRPG